MPKDVSALIAHGHKAATSMRMLESVIRINEEQPKRTVALLRKQWSSLKGIRVAVLGLSFKPETSDVRESPAFPIMRELLDSGAVVKAYDPVAKHEAQRAFPDAKVNYCDSLDAALTDIDAVVVVTPWKEFKDVPARLASSQPKTVFVDGRRAYDKQAVANYEGIGL